MYQVTFIIGGRLHVVNTPNFYTAAILWCRMPHARFWLMRKNSAKLVFTFPRVTR